jgi:hypothetical protein
MLKDFLNKMSSVYNFMCAAVSLTVPYTNYTSMIFSVMYILVTTGRKLFFRKALYIAKNASIRLILFFSVLPLG